MNIRQSAVKIHRYFGLTISIFLIFVALTGSILVFSVEIEQALAPKLFPTEQDKPYLTISQLIKIVREQAPNAMVDQIDFRHPGTAVVTVFQSARQTSLTEPSINFNQILLSPYSGTELGKRNTNELFPSSLDVFIPWIYKLHNNLLFGDLGGLFLGLIGLIWTIDCFLGIYLTLPFSSLGSTRYKKKPALTDFSNTKPLPYIVRWSRSWKVKMHSSTFRFNFDIHRAVGLWLWPGLFIFAWSSVYMNFHNQVYAPVTRLFFDYPEQYWEDSKQASAFNNDLSYKVFEIPVESLMLDQAKKHNFKILHPISYWNDKAHGLIIYTVKSSLDFQENGGQTVIVIDAKSGGVKELILPSSQHRGTTISNWLASLHKADVFGFPYRLYVLAVGLGVISLSITGFYLFFKKRRSIH